MQAPGDATPGVVITKMHDVLRMCTELHLSSSVVASAANFMLNEDHYRRIVHAVSNQCMTRMEHQENRVGRSVPFALLKIGFIFQRSFNQGIRIPAFVLDGSFGDRFGVKQDLSDSTARMLESCESIDETDVDAISSTTGLSREQVAFAIDNITHRIGQLAIEGAFMVLDFGIGTLVIAQHTAEFEFSQQQPDRWEPHTMSHAQTLGGHHDTGHAEHLYPAHPPKSPRHGARRAVLSPRLDLNATTVRPAYAMTGDPTSPPPASQEALALTNGGLVNYFQGGKLDSSGGGRTPSFDAQMKLLTARVSAVLQSTRSGENGALAAPSSQKSPRAVAKDARSTKLPGTAVRSVDASETSGHFSSEAHENLGKVVARTSLSETFSAQLRGRGAVLHRVCKPFGPSIGRGPAQEEKEIRRGKALLKELRIARLGAHANLMGIVKAEFRARADSIVKNAADRKKRSAALDWWWCTITVPNPGSSLAAMVSSPLTRQAHFGSIEERRAVATQIIGAVHHLHEKLGVAHRSLSTANVLTGFGESCPPNARYRLCNFGTVQVIRSKAARKVAPLPFRPPELVAMHESQVMVRTAHDMWAVGAILYEVLVGSPLMAVGSSTGSIKHVETEEEFKATYQGMQAVGRRANLLPRHATDAEVILLEALLHDDIYQRPLTSELSTFSFLSGKTVPPAVGNAIDVDKIEAIEKLEDVQALLEKEEAICNRMYVAPPVETSRGRATRGRSLAGAGAGGGAHGGAAPGGGRRGGPSLSMGRRR